MFRHRPRLLPLPRLLLVVEDIARNIIELYRGPGTEVERRLHRIAQLPYIARPVIGQQGIAHQLAHAGDRPPHVPVVLLHIEIGEQRNVLRPLPQGWQRQLHHTQPVEQVTPQQPFPYCGDRIHIHGGNNTHISVHILFPAHRAEPLLLNRLENLGLEGQIHGVHFVQEQSASISLFQQSFPVFRPGIAPTRSAEQGALQQGGWDGRAVLRHKRPPGPGAVAME